MVQKLIKIGTLSDAGLTEMMMFEFQGDFEHTAVEEFGDLHLAKMTERPGGNFELICGNHLIKGKVVDLPKQVVLGERVKNEDGQVEMVFKAVMRKKVLFSTRPTPLRL